MAILIVVLALGDLVVLALWLRERRRHRKTRNALGIWRGLAGLREVPLRDVETDMVRLRAELRERVQRHRAGRRPVTGGAA